MFLNPFSKFGIVILSLGFYFFVMNLTLAYPIHKFLYLFSFTALLNFLRVIDIKFALPELIGLVTILMYLIAPALMFDLNLQIYLHPNLFGYDVLAVDPPVYYNFAVPAVLLFYISITFFYNKYRSKDYVQRVFIRITERYDVLKLIILCFVVSSVSSLFIGLIPSLNLIFAFGVKLLTVVLILTLLLPSGKIKKVVFTVVILLLMLNTLASGMFSQLVFSLLFYGLFIVLINGMSTKIKILLPFVALILLIFLQVFKGDYRDEAWDENSTDQGYTLAFDIVENIGDNFSEDFMYMAATRTLYRLNQAYLSSRVLDFMPSSQGFVYGETIVAAVASFIPRIFWADKPELSGRSLMEKYGNYTPSEGTSMSIGQLGEAYANFAVVGGVLFFGLYGILVAFTLMFLLRKSNNGKPFILFVSIIMYHMTKPEVIFSKAFNTAFKGIIFFILMMYLINYYCLKVEND